MSTHERHQTRLDLEAALETIAQRRYELASVIQSHPSGRLMLTQIILTICAACLHTAKAVA